MKYNLVTISAISAVFMNPLFSSFHEDSTVTTSEGRIGIGRLRVGQKVNSYSPISTAMGKAEVMYRAQSYRFTRSCIDIDIGARIIRAMPDQLFFDLGGRRWIRAKSLDEDKHVLLGEDGSPITIKDVQLRKKRLLSFPIELSVHSPGKALFVDGVLCYSEDINK